MKPKVGIVHILGKYGMHAMNAEYEIFFLTIMNTVEHPKQLREVQNYMI